MASSSEQTGGENALSNLQRLQKQIRGSSSTEAQSEVANESRRKQMSNSVELTQGNECGNLGSPLEGPIADSHANSAAYVYISQENDGMAQDGGLRTANTEVITAGSSGLSLAFFQQQMMLNQQLIAQQQQTMNSLFTRVDSLAKAIENKGSPQVENGSKNVTPPTDREQSFPVGKKRKIHELSDMEEVSSDSECFSTDSSEDEERLQVKQTNEQQKKTDSEQLREPEKSKGEKSSKCSNLELLKAMGKEFAKTEAVGPKVDDTLAEIVNSGIKNKIDRNVAKELCEKFERPENCGGMIVPKINKELWLTPTMRKNTKEVDKAFQIAQRYLTQGLIPIVTLMNKWLNTENTEEFQLAQNAFQLCAYAHRDISNLRRQQLRGVVADKYKQLCNDSTPLTENLLGDDLEKQIKTMDEMQKVGKDLSKYKYKSDKKSTKGGAQRSSQGPYYKKHDKYTNKHYGQYRNQYDKENPFLWRKSRPYHQSAHKKNKKSEDQK
ncbi:MAG: hypothetical protein JAY96_22530 [Candidatus Thiodiazotropha endolucinida]|nr:hypothetical protein [Candidatus Thiodiazotropha taylori]MCW4250969.1 hypothetical protein [Candidatus Thiodiazotropha endolucinida]